MSEKVGTELFPGRFPDQEKGCLQRPEARAGRGRILKRKVSMLPQGDRKQGRLAAVSAHTSKHLLCAWSCLGIQ